MGDIEITDLENYPWRDDRSARLRFRKPAQRGKSSAPSRRRRAYCHSSQGDEGRACRGVAWGGGVRRLSDGAAATGVARGGAPIYPAWATLSGHLRGLSS